MEKHKNKNKTLLLILILGTILWYIPAPKGLEHQGWHTLVVFIITTLNIMIATIPMGVTALCSIVTLVITNTLPLKTALSGFSSNIVWLVVFAFFIARAFIKSGLGSRIAYYLISKFGHSTIGLAYSLIITEFLLSPIMPSASARGVGIIYPVVRSLANEYDKSTAVKTTSSTGAYLISVCFQTNVITSALFLTAMAANPLIASLAKSLGVNITWLKWSVAAIVPGLINLLILPYFLALLLPPNIKKSKAVPEKASDALRSMGKFTSKECIMIIVFIFLILFWIIGPIINNIDATTTALIGVILLIITGVLSWNDVLGEKDAWEILIWFSVLLMMADSLSHLGITSWVANHIQDLIGNTKNYSIIFVLVLAFFYMHYFFASVTAHATVMYTSFMMMLIYLGVPSLIAAIMLAIVSILSGGLTHYGIASAPVYFSAGYLSVRKWWTIGAIVSTFNLLIWGTVGCLWLYVLGWWKS